MDNRLNSRHKGFSLAEAMMATVVLSIAAAGVLLPFTGGAAVRAEGRRSTLASKLAADLVEQIIRTDFEQIVTAYDGYAEAQGHVKDAGGVVFTDPAGLARPLGTPLHPTQLYSSAFALLLFV